MVNGYTVPCGQCRACKAAKVKEWTLRLQHELLYHDSAAFVTLTYDEKSIPMDGQLSKSDLQHFWKRLRKLYKKQIRYFSVGEYGSKTGRPHYHALIFGIEWCTECRCCSGPHKKRGTPPKPGTGCWYLENAWSAGFVWVGDVGTGAIRYVTGYLQKAMGESPLGGRQLPFQMVSNGIGKQWIEENEDKVLKTMNIRRAGRTISVPRYYKKRLAKMAGKMEPTRAWLMRQAQIRFARERTAKEREELDPLDIAHIEADNRKQIRRNIAAKTRLQRKNDDI